MIVKKITNFAVFAAICLSLVSCADTYTDASSESVPDINCDTETVGHPFDEGYYEGGEYTAKIVYLGNKTEISYGVSICENSSGDEEFFGIVYDVSRDADVLEVPEYNGDGNTVVTLKKANKANNESGYISVSCTSAENSTKTLDGSYKYMGTDWIPQAERDKEVILDGRYKQGDYTLDVKTEGDNLSFTVTDSHGNVLFSGVKKTKNKLNSATISSEYENTAVQFVKCVSADEPCIEVFAFGYYSDIEFLGKYVQAD